MSKALCSLCYCRGGGYTASYLIKSTQRLYDVERTADSSGRAVLNGDLAVTTEPIHRREILASILRS